MTEEISFYDFTILSEERQFELVFKEGEFIDFREVEMNRFVLYKLYSFFVELQYDILQNNIVSKVVFHKQYDK